MNPIKALLIGSLLLVWDASAAQAQTRAGALDTLRASEVARGRAPAFLLFGRPRVTAANEQALRAAAREYALRGSAAAAADQMPAWFLNALPPAAGTAAPAVQAAPAAPPAPVRPPKPTNR